MTFNLSKSYNDKSDSVVRGSEGSSEALGSSKIHRAVSRSEHAGKAPGNVSSSSMANRIAAALPCGYFSDFPAAETTDCFARNITGKLKEILGGLFISTETVHFLSSLISSRLG